VKAERALIALFICLLIGENGYANSGAATLPVPLDLQRDARQAQMEGKPVLILFPLPGCSYCHVIRQNYLAPLLRGLPVEDRPIIREIGMISTQTFVGFHGERTSHQDFAKNFDVRVAPTVVFVDSSGRLLTEPIVGGDTAGLYGGYLDNAFTDAAKNISAARRNN
jgi:thioredoxin-related protein